MIDPKEYEKLWAGYGLAFGGSFVLGAITYLINLSRTIK
jgi:hypothetical protein